MPQFGSLDLHYRPLRFFNHCNCTSWSNAGLLCIIFISFIFHSLLALPLPLARFRMCHLPPTLPTPIPLSSCSWLNQNDESWRVNYLQTSTNQHGTEFEICHVSQFLPLGFVLLLENAELLFEKLSAQQIMFGEPVGSQPVRLEWSQFKHWTVRANFSNQILLYLPSTMLISTIDFYTFYTTFSNVTLAGDHNVASKQTLLAAFSHPEANYQWDLLNQGKWARFYWVHPERERERDFNAGKAIGRLWTDLVKTWYDDKRY